MIIVMYNPSITFARDTQIDEDITPTKTKGWFLPNIGISNMLRNIVMIIKNAYTMDNDNLKVQVHKIWTF